MIDCIVYVSSVANPQKFPRKIACLESFALGVKAQGGSVLVQWNHDYQPSRLAVILGWATTNVGGKNISLRKQIISEQKRLGYQTMCIDASCFKYLDNQGTYLRYSLDGPFYDHAQYANQHSTSQHWQEISQALHLDIKPNAIRNDGYILLGMQRDGGFAMKTLDPMTWLEQKIHQIRSVTARPIVVRPHPGKYNMQDFIKYSGKLGNKLRVSVANPEKISLLDNLHQAHSAVFFNSSATVAAVLHGIPVFVDDKSCVSWSVANKDLGKIESPEFFDREQWIWDLAAAHWSDQQSRAGMIYQKFLPYI